MSELDDALGHEAALTGMLAEELDDEDPDQGLLEDVLAEKIAAGQRISELAERAWEKARQAWMTGGAADG